MNFHTICLLVWEIFFFLMIRRPPKSTLFPTRRSSDLLLILHHVKAGQHSDGQHHVHDRPGEGDNHERDRKSTRLNSSHVEISYAVFCLKKKTSWSFARLTNSSSASWSQTAQSHFVASS